MGSNDRAHQKLHGVEKRITAARRGHGTACVRGGRGRRGFLGGVGGEWMGEITENPLQQRCL